VRYKRVAVLAVGINIRVVIKKYHE